MKKKNDFELELTSQTLQVNKLNLLKFEINENLKDSWIKFENNSIASFKKVFIKLQTLDKENYYLILDNVFMSRVDNLINLKYNDELVIYESNESAIEQSEWQKANAEKLLEIKTQLKYFRALLEINYSPEIKSKISKLETEIYKLEAIDLFNLDMVKEFKWNQ